MFCKEMIGATQKLTFLINLKPKDLTRIQTTELDHITSQNVACIHLYTCKHNNISEMLLCNSPACICLFQFIYFHFIKFLTQYFLFLCYALGKEDTNPGKNGGGYIIPGI